MMEDFGWRGLNFCRFKFFKMYLDGFNIEK